MNKKWMYPVVGLLILASLPGCGKSSTGPNPKTQNAAQTQKAAQTQNAAHTQKARPQAGTQGTAQTNMHPYTTNYFHYDGTQQRMGVNQFDRIAAERLVRAASTVPGVSGATAVVHGNDAVIGVKTRFPANQTQQRQVIEQKVHAAARSASPQMRIRVTSDDHMYGRVHRLSTSLTHGVSNAAHSLTTGPTTVGGNLSNAAGDFTALIRDLGRSVTAPFR
ncbi:YhcN/YlaJ family sporulation lipoprotein [Brevibacillus ruminantium]|uniref:YhcN/YlaJ family sporulation lipoprotein n=1 Tax=Brevibacillus ruminantium TaxID=2950604 RepID=A0ABY4WK23_9BACL|nr:YhcN/YlaJ family sporulation lipoprotein [Brevibacillus ruminantium]USG67513.1 YhcN/YlaJ family sporulation lipoprotein [Brevibacillus ruminantium]